MAAARRRTGSAETAATGKIRGRFFAKSLLSPGLVGAAILCAAATARAAAIGLTITPSAFTNDFVGKFALAIANLTSGMTVTVEQYNDLNTNGIIDADDLLVGSFQVTDGLVPLLAGIRNLNVPGDDDGLTNGQILVQYNYPGVEGAILAGKFLFRVSDPKGLLTSVTQACSVAQHIYPQIVTGRVTASGTGRPLTNCILGAVSFGSPAQVMLTDTNGFYSFYGVPPAYVVFGFNQQGAVFNQAQLVSLTCGQAATNNLVMSLGTFFIAGKVTDGATGTGLTNLQVDANAPNNLGADTFTDANGNYAWQVTANTWSLHSTAGPAAFRGYVDPTRTSVTVSSASVSNVNFVLSKATSLIYGTITDSGHNPVAGIQLDARDQPNNFHNIGRTLPPMAPTASACRPAPGMSCQIPRTWQTRDTSAGPRT